MALENLSETVQEYRPYLEDIVFRIRRVAFVFLVIFVLGFFCASAIVRKLIAILNLENVTIVVTSPFQLFNLSIDISFFLASTIAVPYLIWNVYAFLRSGLTKDESGSIFKVIPVSLGLFCLGVAFGGVSMYWGLSFMAKQAAIFGIQNFWDVGTFVSQLVTTSALLGVIFQFPIILALLLRSGIIEVTYLEGKRPIVYAMTLILVALLPPSDGISLIVMTMPLIALYELTLVMYRRR